MKKLMTDPMRYTCAGTGNRGNYLNPETLLALYLSGECDKSYSGGRAIYDFGDITYYVVTTPVRAEGTER